MIIVVLRQRSACWSSLDVPNRGLRFQSFCLVRTLVMVPENRVAMAPIRRSR